MKIQVGVFFGGKSVEHEVSVVSAMQALAALDGGRYQPVPVYVTKDNDFYTGPAAGRLERYRDIPALLAELTQVDLVKEAGGPCLMRRRRRRLGGNTVAALDVALLVFHGAAGESGVFQGVFEAAGLPYTGCDVTASAIGMDKWAMKALFGAAGVPCLPAVRVGREAYYVGAEPLLARVEGQIGYPCIVKPYNLGSSVGIGRAENRRQLESALEDALDYAPLALCERAVTPLREINCAVLGDHHEARASVCEEPLLAGEWLTFEDKYQRGGKGAKSGAKAAPAQGAKGGMASLARQVPSDLAPEVTAQIQALAVRAFQAIGAAGVARVDFLMQADTGEIWVNEINTIPGSLSFYLWEAAGLSFSALLDEMIALALRRERERERLTASFDTNLLQTVRLGGGAKSGAKGG